MMAARGARIVGDPATHIATAADLSNRWSPRHIAAEEESRPDRGACGQLTIAMNWSSFRHSVPYFLAFSAFDEPEPGSAITR